MRMWIVSLALLAASPALAKPWNGMEPGVSTRDDVIKKFGSPTQIVPAGDKEVLAYLDKEAIKGTKQVQFRVVKDTGVVERIDVFPGPVVDKDTVESSFGPPCGPSAPAAEACYSKKITEDFRTYYVYAKLGMAVFFNEDAKTVGSFVYQTVKAEQPAKADAPPPGKKAKGAKAP